jgi:hypothetical protein
VDINRTVLLQSDNLLADLLPESDDDQKIRFKGGKPLNHPRRIDIFGFDTGDIVPGAPEVNIGMMGLASVAASRSCRLCKHTRQFMTAVINGLQARNAELS